MWDFILTSSFPFSIFHSKAMHAQMKVAITRLSAMGGEQVDIDFTPFADTANLLYGGPFVAERYSGVSDFLEANTAGLKSPHLAPVLDDQRLMKVTRFIIAKSKDWSAPDVYSAFHRLSTLRAAARKELSKIDFLVVPTAEYNYTVREVLEEEEADDSHPPKPEKNTNLGRWTNFVNLLDMCGVSVPSGVLRLEDADVRAILQSRPNGEHERVILRRYEYLMATGNPSPVVPFGVTFLAPAWTDQYLADVAIAYEKVTGLKAGPRGHGVTPYTSRKS